MSNSQKIPNVEKDEIDLGNVLNTIGNLFEKLYNFFKDILTKLFGLTLQLLILIRDNIWKFVVFAIVSFSVGLAFDYYEKPVYYSSMTVQPNFGSTNQLYSDIRYYDGLATIKDSVALSKIFGISQFEGASIDNFQIQPNSDENELLLKYDAFLAIINDSINTPDTDYKTFKLNISPTEFSNHIIIVGSEDPTVFKKLENQIIKGNIAGNKFLQKQRVKEFENYAIKESSLAKQEEKIDSLRNIYNKVLIKSAEKISSSGTSIQLASNQMKTNEMELFAIEKQINIELQNINTSKTLKADMINVIHGFQIRGKVIEKDFFDRKAVKFLTFGLLLLLAFLLLKSLNKYLNNYKK